LTKTSEIKSRIDTCYELIVRGLRDAEIIKTIRRDDRFKWPVSTKRLYYYLILAHKELDAEAEHIKRSIDSAVINGYKEIYKKLTNAGDFYKASLVLKTLDERLTGKPTQKFEVKHHDTNPRTVIQINGETVNFAIDATHEQKQLPEIVEDNRPWYEIIAAEPIDTPTERAKLSESEKRGQRTGTIKKELIKELFNSDNT
jgi:hypothetical protein